MGKFLIFILMAFSLSGEFYKTVIFWSGLGEHEWAKRLEKGCQKLGWEALVVFGTDEFSGYNLLVQDRPVTPEEVQHILREFKPDFTISLKEVIPTEGIPNYLALTGLNKRSFKGRDDFLGVDGFLICSSETDLLKSFIEDKGKAYHEIPWYPSCVATKYQPTVPRKLFYGGFLWDKKRTGKNYREMFSLLDQTGYLATFGYPDDWKHTPRSFGGLLPFGGERVVQAMREAGIALVLQTNLHMELGAPTARIFEAAAACCVIIAEKNPFIVREFKDSVLYIDSNLTGKELFSQMDAHVQWIFSHPKEAEKMARRAHTIFMEKFTLEDHLKRLAALHEQIKIEKEIR